MIKLPVRPFCNKMQLTAGSDLHRRHIFPSSLQNHSSRLQDMFCVALGKQTE